MDYLSLMLEIATAADDIGRALRGELFYEYDSRSGQMRLRERKKAPRRRGRGCCGARTRKGTPCRALSLPGKSRCHLHGGMSTGPKTPEGRARIAESNRRRVDQRRFSVVVNGAGQGHIPVPVVNIGDKQVNVASG